MEIESGTYDVVNAKENLCLLMKIGFIEIIIIIIYLRNIEYFIPKKQKILNQENGNVYAKIFLNYIQKNAKK